MLALAYGKAGDPQRGEELFNEALAMMEDGGQRLDEAELHRIRGELYLVGTAGDMGKSETCFKQALKVARRQKAKSLELRAATSLARLWQGQGKPAEARKKLAPIHDWFTEGFDTPDLKEAKALLDDLAQPSRAVG